MHPYKGSIVGREICYFEGARSSEEEHKNNHIRYSSSNKILLLLKEWLLLTDTLKEGKILIHKHKYEELNGGLVQTRFQI